MENFINLITDVWNRGFFGIDLGSIISSLIVILIAFLFRGFIISVVLNALEKVASRTKSTIDDEILNALKKPLGFIPITIALYICTLILPLTGLIDEIATNVVKTFVIFTIFSALANSIQPIFAALSAKDWLTPAVFKALIEAKHHVGYSLYLDLISGLGKYAKSHTFPLGSEIERAKAALDLASASEDTVLVCSGDSGVYGMASLVFELMDHQRQTNWQFVEVIVEPGISAMQAAAARSGAPLGHPPGD